MVFSLFLKYRVKSLDEAPSATLQRLLQPFPKSFLAEVHRKSRCVKQPGKVGKAAEAAHMAHPIGWSVYGVAAQSLATVLEETQLTYMRRH